MEKTFSHRIQTLLSAALDWPPTLSDRAHRSYLAVTLAAGAASLAVAFSPPMQPSVEWEDPIRPRPAAIADAKDDAARKRAQEAAWEKELKWRQEANEEASRNRKREEAVTEKRRAADEAWEKELKWRKEANEEARRNKKRDDAETERLKKK